MTYFHASLCSGRLDVDSFVDSRLVDEILLHIYNELTTYLLRLWSCRAFLHIGSKSVLAGMYLIVVEVNC